MARKATAIAEPLTKARLMSAVAEDTGLAKKDVVAVFESLTDVLVRHLKPRGAGVFTMPGLAKFTVVKKPARKARKGINPFTGEEIMIKAKPASRAVRIRALKGLKDAI